MNPLSSELPFHVHNWLIISLKDFCFVIRKWPTFWPSRFLIDDHTYGLILKILMLVLNNRLIVVSRRRKNWTFSDYNTEIVCINYFLSSHKNTIAILKNTL